MPFPSTSHAILEANTVCQHIRPLRSFSVRLYTTQLGSLSHSACVSRSQAPFCSVLRSATRLQAYRKPLPHGRDDSFYDATPVVDTTAEEVSTSGRSSEDDRDQQHRPNILKRAATAAVGLVAAFFNWLKSNARLKRLFDRYVASCYATNHCALAMGASVFFMTCVCAGAFCCILYTLCLVSSS